MIYWLFPELNPLLPIFVFCPILSTLIGTGYAVFKRKVYMGMFVAFLLPLLYILTDLASLKVNLDAWLMYGIIYVLITFSVYKLVHSQLRKASL